MGATGLSPPSRNTAPGSPSSPTRRSTRGRRSSCATSRSAAGSSRWSRTSGRRRRLNEHEFERVFASGGGAPATIGHDAQGHLIVPAVALWALVPGIRSQVTDGRERLIEYLVANFDELVYV